MNLFLFLANLKKLLLVIFVGFAAWAFQTARPPPPKTPGSPDGPAITSPRIKLCDGRHLAYEESGVPKDTAKAKIIFVHGFGDTKSYHPFDAIASPALVNELGVYFVSLDRPGYGESDPNPNRTVKSLALDIEELADQLNLGSRFYVVGYSMGGQATEQGEFESLHRDLNIGFGKWEFDPMDLENPFPNKDGTVHLWMGNEDLVVPVTLQCYIAQQIEWINYHEVTGTGHLLGYITEVVDDILKSLLKNQI